VVVGLVGAGPPDSVVPPKGPADLWTPAASGRLWFAVLVAVSVCVLAVAFVVLHRRAGTGRIGIRTVGTAAVLVVRLWLARRPARAGTALQVTALVAPTVHAWYLTWGLPLAGTASRWAQQATVAVCVALCFTAMPETLSRRPAGIALTVALLVVALATVALPGLRARRADRAARTTA
jgi:hypothetical protein